MAGVGIALRGLGKVLSKFAKKQKTTGGGAIRSVPPSKANKKFAEAKEKISKNTSAFTKKVDDPTKIKMRSGTSKALSKISKILKKD